MAGFAERVRSGSAAIFEVIPPSSGTAHEGMVEGLWDLRDMTAHLRLDGINIPEIHNEARPGMRSVGFVPKIEPRAYGMLIESVFGSSVEAVVNRCSVRSPHDEQGEWLATTWRDFGIRNLVIVGGESSSISYPGPSVAEMSAMISRQLNIGLAVQASGHAFGGDTGFFCGGITIPGRTGAITEAQRLLAKAGHGLEFFTSQVIYEADSVKLLLKDYDRLCKSFSQEPRMVFLSFAPVSRKRDIEFLKWLGVRIHKETENELLGRDICKNSFRIAEGLLAGILSYCRDNDVSVPIGLNIEHIMRHNLQASVELAGLLSDAFKGI